MSFITGVLQVVVQHVNIQGLGRTKEDLLGYEISDVFHAKNLIDVRTVQQWTPPAPQKKTTFYPFECVFNASSSSPCGG